MKKILIILGYLILSSSLLFAQSRGTPNNLRVFTDANGALVAASASQVLPLSQPTLFSNTRLATDASGNLLVVVSGLSAGCPGDCSITNLLFPSATSTSSSGIIYKGTAVAGNRFLHNFAPSGSNGENTFLGLGAGNFTMTFSAGEDSSLNTGIGWHALTALTTGFANVAIGDEAMQACTTCNQNTAVGHAAGTSLLTAATANTLIGVHAGRALTTATNSTAIGADSLSHATTAGPNTAVGQGALNNTTSGFGNVAVGDLALNQNTGGFANTAIGSSALTTTTGVISNVAIGYNAMVNATGGSGSNTCIGTNCGAGLTSGDNNVLIGNGANTSLATVTNSIVIGSTATVATSNTTVIGTSSSTSFKLFGTLQTTGAALAVADVGASSCGTTAATITGNDNSGEITVGATAGTQCRVTFAVAAPTRRMCVANDGTTTVAVRSTYVDTTHTDFTGTFTAADTIQFICLTR